MVLAEHILPQPMLVMVLIMFVQVVGVLSMWY